MDAHARSPLDLLTVGEAAEALRCSKATIYRAVKEHRIEWFRLREGGEIRIPYYALAALIAPHLHDVAEKATTATTVGA